MYAAIGILIVLVAVYLMTKPKETFVNACGLPDDTAATTLPKTIKPPPPVVKTDPSPSHPLIGSMPSAPYQQVARNMPLAYQDPALQKTTRQRILNAIEMLKGFLAFQANEVEYRSDPSIQLPLTNARADFQRLSDEASVLQRNPGLQPDMTEQHLNDIMNNLAFLQREVGLIGANRPFENTGLQNLEAFENPTDIPATEDELRDFSAKVQGEIIRMSASGTTDPETNARITNLTAMRAQVDDVITKLQSGSLLPPEVPIKQTDIKKALPVLGNPNEPLPQILKSLSLPSGLGNMLPSNAGNDPAINRTQAGLMVEYAKEFLQGVTASVKVNLKYTPAREVEIEQARAKARESSIDITGFPSPHDLDNITQGSSTASLGAPGAQQSNGVVGASNASGSFAIDPNAHDPRIEGRAPSHFDWHERSKHIDGQIRQRGYPDSVFGIMPAGNSVGPEFNWKGYAQMICTRLQSSADTGLPETCGCPPQDWIGWNR